MPRSARHDAHNMSLLGWLRAPWYGGYLSHRRLNPAMRAVKRPVRQGIRGRCVLPRNTLGAKGVARPFPTYRQCTPEAEKT